MFFKYLIYFILCFISFMSFVTLIYSIVNKNKYVSKLIIPFIIIYVLYYLGVMLVWDAWYIPIGLEILFIYMFMVVAVVIYIISIIINIVKIIKSKVNEKSTKHLTIMICLLIFPIALLFANYIIVKSTIADSDLYLVYESSGNGGIGDSDTFAYAIKDDGCIQFDLGIEIGGAYLKDFISSKYEDIEFDIPDDSSYIELDEYSILYDDYARDDYIYKNGEKVCKIDTDKYFNIELSSIYKK